MGLIHHTDCILMISWLGKYRSVRSRISIGSATKWDIDADIVLMEFVVVVAVSVDEK